MQNHIPIFAFLVGAKGDEIKQYLALDVNSAYDVVFILSLLRHAAPVPR